MSPVVVALLSERQIAEPDVALVVAFDIVAAAATEGARLGLPPDRRGATPERLGGVVAGKTVTALDGTRAVVILDGALAAADDPLARLWTAEALGHELGHVAYGACRDATVGHVEDRWLPWEVAEVLAYVVAEEWRVDRFAQALVGQIPMHAHLPGHEPDVVDLVRARYAAAMEDALAAVDPGLSEIVWSYRTRSLALEEMWGHVVRISEQAAIFLAHADAHSAGEAIRASRHRGLTLLRPFWEPLADHLHARSALPAADEWPEDRAALATIGREGWAEVWARLGLYARPEGDAFYLEVRDVSAY